MNGQGQWVAGNFVENKLMVDIIVIDLPSKFLFHCIYLLAFWIIQFCNFPTVVHQNLQKHLYY